MVADEVGEVADRLHRHRLVEQLHGLLGLDAEAAAEILAVLGEAVVHADAADARSRLRRAAMSVPKSAKSPATDSGSIRGHVEPVRLPPASPPRIQNTWARVTVAS